MSDSQPSPGPGYEDYGLNWVFIFRVYLVLALLCVALAAAQYQFHVTSVTGFWLVPAPTIIALPFAYVWAERQRAFPPGARTPAKEVPAGGTKPLAE